MNTKVTIDLDTLNLLVAVVLPILVALVTRRFAASWFKAVTLLALSVLSGWLGDLAAHDGTFVLGRAVAEIVVAFVVAVAAHYGLWKPVGLTGSGGLVATVVPAGVGPLRSPAA